MLVPLTEGWKLLRHDPNSMLFITTLQKLKAISHWESPSNSLTLGEERRLRALGNRVLRRIFGSKRDKVAGGGENYIMRSLIICTAHQILFGR